MGSHQREDRQNRPRPEHQDKTKSGFLSATPFAYHQNLDYADKLLFDYEQDYTPTFGYNAPSARQAFSSVTSATGCEPES